MKVDENLQEFTESMKVFVICDLKSRQTINKI